MPARPRLAAHELPRYSPDSRRELLLDAARSIFIQRGFAQARTKDIAERAGVAEGLVFKYFGSKESLFEHAVLEPLQRAVAALTAAAESFELLEDSQKREQGERFHQQMLEAMIDVAPLLGLALFSEREKGENFYQTHIWPMVEAMAEAVSRTTSSTTGTAVDPHVVAIVMSGAFFCYGIDSQLRPGKSMSPVEFATQMTRLIAGSASTQGLKQP